ncbi:MAG: hypothetical protein UT13_C0001G0728 [Candidatus Pacebacteria bacterium GW2011_GWF2_38_9]|nr:MAG: hypothetical protein US01_C0001G0761 [candidate division TM6 bacterium GW2011_GWF2_28_16]KKQ10124.1 MAG: hypothetical protein US20_C0003G0064 [Candidatus Pacebacteria bacterium GW2011_GWF1_36_5]KKQ89080.1 MAG: hypothetical protein UT13_C0001G0728 [Candidatus Pacebacteria bacterium GW2011_GWF2_38_9]HAZ73580.1 hypothetical protein [Candidatus Paceibacterota bacterium]
MNFLKDIIENKAYKIGRISGIISSLFFLFLAMVISFIGLYALESYPVFSFVFFDNFLVKVLFMEIFFIIPCFFLSTVLSALLSFKEAKYNQKSGHFVLKNILASFSVILIFNTFVMVMTSFTTFLVPTIRNRFGV